MMFDLLTTVEYGGCSSKISPEILDELLSKLNFDIAGSPPLPPLPRGAKDKNLLVGIDTHDDAAVYKLNDEQCLIFTTDFFPPVCSDPFTFGQIAATNALSDVYAMGGKVLMALNLIMFPSQKIPLEVLAEILKGGQSKVYEAGGIIAGGHTIDDYPPKYGLAVIGLVHPCDLVTNAHAQPGDVLILTKPIGTGVIMAGKRLNMVSDENYLNALENMKLLNKEAARLMNKYDVKAGTDITGFGLIGHALKMAKASKVSIEIDIENVPVLPSTLELLNDGCIPGASFRNQTFAESNGVDLSGTSYEKKMLMYDAQTSGGMLMCVKRDVSQDLLDELKEYYPESKIIGQIGRTSVGAISTSPVSDT